MKKITIAFRIPYSTLLSGILLISLFILPAAMAQQLTIVPLQNSELRQVQASPVITQEMFRSLGAPASGATKAAALQL